jgi:hypothetical protein
VIEDQITPHAHDIDGGPAGGRCDPAAGSSLRQPALGRRSLCRVGHAADQGNQCHRDDGTDQIAEYPSRNFGSVQAVSDLSFSLERRSVTGFLGPKGGGEPRYVIEALIVIVPGELLPTWREVIFSCALAARIRHRAANHSAAPGRSDTLGAISRGPAGRFIGRG